MATRQSPQKTSRLSLTPEFKVSLVKWIAGTVVGVVGFYAGWKQVIWPDIRDTWRLEAVAAKKDGEHEQALKDAKAAIDLQIKEHKDDDKKNVDDLSRKIDTKSEDLSRDIKTLSKAAEQRNAWTQSGISNLSVGVLGLALSDCRAKNKGNAEACQTAADALTAARQEAVTNKSNAQALTNKAASP